MSLQSTILNARNARRSNNIRNEEDPQVVIKQLEEILLQSVNIQNSGSREYQTKALKELKQLRSDMVTGQIDAGSKGNQYVGLYSHVIDQLESMVESTSESNNRFADGVGSIRDAMPSTDSLIAALMTANPIVGYGAKIMMDITRGRREGKRQKRDDQKKRLSFLKEQEAYIKTQLDQQVDQQSVLDGQLDGLEADRADRDNGGLYGKLLTEIRDEIKRLESSLSRNDNSMEEGLNDINDNLDDQLDLTGDIETSRARNARLSQLDSDEELEIPVPTPVDGNNDTQQKGGILDALLGAPFKIIKMLAMGFVGFFTGIAGILGFGGAAAGAGFIAKLFSPIKALIGFVFSIGKFALSMGSALLLPAVIIASLYSFFDGFFNADKILGLNDSDITLGDRILVGISNVLAMFTKVFDWILLGVNKALEFFGFEGFGQIDTEGLTKRIYDFFTRVPEMVNEFLESPLEHISNGLRAMFDWYVDVSLKFAVIIKDVLVKLFDWYVDKWKMVGNFIKDKLVDAFDFVVDKVSRGIEYVVEGIKKGLNDAWDYVVMQTSLAIEYVVEGIKKGFKAAFDYVVMQTSLAIEYVVESVKSIVNNIKNSLVSAFDYVVMQTSLAIEYVINTIRSAFDYVKDTFDQLNLKERITTFFNELPQKISDLFFGIVDSLNEGLDKSIAYVKEIGTELFESMMGSINTFIDKVKEVMQSITDTFKNAFSAIENKILEWSDDLSRIPGIGRFFTAKEDEDNVVSRTYSMSEGGRARIEQMLENVTSPENVLRVGKDGATATRVPLQTKEQLADTMRYAEMQQQQQQSINSNVVVNSPSTVNNSAKTVTSNNNTSNPNNIHRRMSNMNYMR